MSKLITLNDIHSYNKKYHCHNCDYILEMTDKKLYCSLCHGCDYYIDNVNKLHVFYGMVGVIDAYKSAWMLIMFNENRLDFYSSQNSINRNQHVKMTSADPEFLNLFEINENGKNNSRELFERIKRLNAFS